MTAPEATMAPTEASDVLVTRTCGAGRRGTGRRGTGRRVMREDREEDKAEMFRGLLLYRLLPL
jgi:hypothetical protein